MMTHEEMQAVFTDARLYDSLADLEELAAMQPPPVYQYAETEAALMALLTHAAARMPKQRLFADSLSQWLACRTMPDGSPEPQRRAPLVLHPMAENKPLALAQAYFAAARLVYFEQAPALYHRGAGDAPPAKLTEQETAALKSAFEYIRRAALDFISTLQRIDAKAEEIAQRRPAKAARSTTPKQAPGAPQEAAGTPAEAPPAMA